jgi:ferrous iron transport protein A
VMDMETTLSHLNQDSTATILRLEGGPVFQRRLRTTGIREGKIIRVVTKQPLGGPLVIEIDGRETTIGRGMSQRIVVSERI